jgi:WhiB family redox-sensing transcriptional regulator
LFVDCNFFIYHIYSKKGEYMSEQTVRFQPEHLSPVPGAKMQTPLDDMGRPPTMSDAELTSVLERGRLVSRLRAAQKLSSVVVAYANDTVTESFITSTYLDQVLCNVDLLESELMQFDVASITNDTSCEARVDSKVDQSPKAPTIKQISADFLRRRQTAVCAQTDPEVFFPEKGGSTKQAKKVCEQSCDIKDECLSYALENGERFGVWGGLSERERRKLSKKAIA